MNSGEEPREDELLGCQTESLPLRRMAELIEPLASEEFYGEVAFKFAKGKVVFKTVTQTLK